MTLDILEVVRHADGEVVGKIRLQKMVYLLSRMGYNLGFPFEYHHYGPYSRELAEKIEEEVDDGSLTAKVRRRQSDGVPYVVYRLEEVTRSTCDVPKLRQSLKEMNNCSPTVLELAATIDWLAKIEGYANWRSELQVRKGVKTAGGRVEMALDLLKKLGLSPST